MSCTTILVGRKASYDGSTLVARNEDSGAGAYSPKKFIVVQPEEQPKIYKPVLSDVEIPLPSNPMRYTLMPNAVAGEGIWGAFGVNEKNISMTATETLTTNERVLGADPLLNYTAEDGTKKRSGIGEEDMVSIVLPYINSAREGVLRLGELLTVYGTYEMNGIAFQDENEIWWLETIGGHHWMARRVPDEAYVVMPNQLGLDHFDFEDAYGEQKEFLCSCDLKEFVDKYHLDLSLDGNFNPRDAFGSHSDADHIYNTPRSWVLQRYFNPTSNYWDGVDADLRPDSDDIPWYRIPEKKITIEDIKYALSHHYQGTPFDPYSKHAGGEHGRFRPIGINRNNVLGLVQIRPYMPEAIKSVEWIALGSNVFNAMIPFYSNINDTPAYLKNTTDLVTTEDFYWSNRIIAALADSQFADCSSYIERYQQSLQSKGLAIIHEYDEKIVAGKLNYNDAAGLCEEANEKVAKEAREQTNYLLDKVLLTVSNKMRNGFSRSDA